MLQRGRHACISAHRDKFIPLRGALALTTTYLLEHDSRRNGIGTAGLALGFLAALGKAALAPVALKADSFQRGLSKRRAQELLVTAHRERLKAGKSK